MTVCDSLQLLTVAVCLVQPMAKLLCPLQPLAPLQTTPVTQAMILWEILHVHAKVMNSGQEVNQLVKVSSLLISFQPLSFIIIINTASLNCTPASWLE